MSQDHRKKARPAYQRDPVLWRSLLRCFGAAGPGLPVEERSLWRACSASDLEELRSQFGATNATFAKENFAALTIDQFAKQPGVRVYVALRPPWLTFPVTSYQEWWQGVYRAFVGSDEQWQPFPSLTRLRQHLQTTHPVQRTPAQLQSCLAHYVHFFHLVSRARALGVPVLRTDTVLTLSRAQLEVYLRKSMPGYSQASIEKLTAVVTELRDKPLNVHNTQTRRIAHGPTVSASLFDAHLRQWNATGCGPSLEKLASWCAAQLDDCTAFNDLYGFGAGASRT